MLAEGGASERINHSIFDHLILHTYFNTTADVFHYYN